MTRRPLIALALLAALSGCAGAPPAPTTAAGAPAQPAPLGVESAVRLGEAALAGGDAASAARLLAAAAQTYPEDPRPRRALAEAYYAMGALPEAAQAFRDLAAMPGQTAAAEIGLGRVALSSGDPETGAARFGAALALEADNIAALNGAAVAEDLRGRHAQAERLYARLLTLDPTNRAAMTNRALSKALAGDPAGAALALDPLARGPAGSRPARHNLALAYALAGRMEAADAILAAELTPVQVAENMAFYRRLAR